MSEKNGMHLRYFLKEQSKMEIMNKRNAPTVFLREIIENRNDIRYGKNFTNNVC